MTPNPCVHHDICENPIDGVQLARCKKCGRQRVYPTGQVKADSWDRYLWGVIRNASEEGGDDLGED